MANRWETMETVADFIFLDSKFTADGDCGHKIRINKQKQTKKLAFWKKSYYKPRQLCKKQRHNFADKGLSSQTYGFSSCHVWMRELDYKKADHQRIDAFELWCWRRILSVTWTSRKSNQSILKEINPEYSLKGLMLKLKLQYCGHLMGRANSLEKTLVLGKIEGNRRRG